MIATGRMPCQRVRAAGFAPGGTFTVGGAEVVCADSRGHQVTVLRGRVTVAP